MLKSTSSDEAISLPFIWGRAGKGSRLRWSIDPDENFDSLFGQQPEEVYWWQLRSASDSGGGDSGGIGLEPVSFEEQSSGYDFLLALGKNEKLAPYIKSDRPIKLKSSDPNSVRLLMLAQNIAKSMRILDKSNWSMIRRSLISSRPDPSLSSSVIDSQGLQQMTKHLLPNSEYFVST